MVIRSRVSARDLPKLYDAIERRVDLVGVETAPEVAARLTDLAGTSYTGAAEYAKIIRHDPALSGRLLRLANSAYFAQRDPVTRVERAAVLLGIERLRAVSLGFYTPVREAHHPDTLAVRDHWRRCLYRATLASSLATAVCPGARSEAFVVGMMLDSGTSVISRLLGQRHAQTIAEAESPGEIFHVEFESLPFTHVDVAAALCRRWRLPELIAKPVRWHHDKPSDLDRNETLHHLHRIAYVVGGMTLGEGQDFHDDAELPPAAARAILGMGHAKSRTLAHEARNRYEDVLAEYESLLATVPSLPGIIEHARRKLIDEFDAALLRTMNDAMDSKPSRFRVGGNEIEIEIATGGEGAAYLLNGDGERIAAHRFRAGEGAGRSLLDGLLLEPEPGDDVDDLTHYVERFAA